MNALFHLTQFSTSTKTGYLYSAWKDLTEKVSIQKRTVVSGVDGITLDAFSSNLEENLKSIAEEVRAGKYRFSKLKANFVPKPGSDKFRLICVPTIRDRILQKALQTFLSEDDPYGFNNGVSFGFIKGQGVESAVTKAIDLRNRINYAYKTDIEQFFDTVSRQILEEKIKKHIRHKSLHPLLMKALACEIQQLKGDQARLLGTTNVTVGKGVRQGMPLSPFFSNLMLNEFDKSVKVKKYQMVRYADDLIIMSKSNEESLEIHNFCKGELNKIGLSIPDIGTKKTKVYAPNEIAEFLGIGIERKLNGKYQAIVTRDQQSKIESKIVALSSFEKLAKEGLTITKFFRRLESMRGGYRAAYDFCNKSNRDDLFNKIDQWIVLTKIRIYRDNLGINLDNLSNDKKQFLELKS